jgi:hypothetical protein
MASTGEVLVLIRHHASAGSKEFEFFRSGEAFRDRLAGLPPRTCITVFRDMQLPRRGTVDPGFVAAAVAAIPDGTEWLAVSLQRSHHGALSWFHCSAGETHAELRAALEDCLGTSVAVGAYPPWLEDNEAVVSAVVPDPDGAVVSGIY